MTSFVYLQSLIVVLFIVTISGSGFPVMDQIETSHSKIKM